MIIDQKIESLRYSLKTARGMKRKGWVHTAKLIALILLVFVPVIVVAAYVVTK